MAESQAFQAFVLVVHIIIGKGGSLYSRINMKEKLMEVSIFLICVKKCSA